MEYPIQTSHSQTQAEWLLRSPSVSLYQWHWQCHQSMLLVIWSSGLLPLTVTQLLHNLWWCLTLTDWSQTISSPGLSPDTVIVRPQWWAHQQVRSCIHYAAYAVFYHLHQSKHWSLKTVHWVTETPYAALAAATSVRNMYQLLYYIQGLFFSHKTPTQGREIIILTNHN